MVEEIKISGGKEEEKTPEQELEGKKRRFEEDPNSFVELSEIIVATKRSKGGIELFVNRFSKRNELSYSLGELTAEIVNVMTFLKVQAMKEQKVHLASPMPGENRSKLRNFLNRK